MVPKRFEPLKFDCTSLHEIYIRLFALTNWKFFVYAAMVDFRDFVRSLFPKVIWKSNTA